MSDKKRYLMAVDAGTGSVRAVIFDTDGNQIECISREWVHREDPRWPGSMDFDWASGWDDTCYCIRTALEKTDIDPESILGVSTTCMREGILLYDGSGNEIWACANVDSRANDEVARLVREDSLLEKKIYERTGEAYALGAIPRLLWVKDKMPDIYDKASKIGMFNDWLIYRLTGDLAVEPSNASTTGLFNLKFGRWDLEIAEKCGIRTDIFPDIAECGTSAGTVSEKASGETGLAAGTPVITGGGDCQLGCIGVGATRPGEAAVFGGSFWQYEFNTENGDTDPGCRVRVNSHAIPGIWQYEALAFKPGLVMRWYRDAFCQRELETAAATGVDPYDLMNTEAEKIPAGCYGMMCTFSDVMNFTCWKHASPSFLNFGLEPDKFNRYTFYRAILENTCLVTRGHLELVREATGNMPEKLIFAGGASKSSLWCQILADVTGLPVKVPVVKEATALGAAILAGHGAGIYPDISEAADKLVKWDREYTPDPEAHGVYDEMYGVWKEVYAAQLKLCDSGLTTNMWKAPGL